MKTSDKVPGGWLFESVANQRSAEIILKLVENNENIIIAGGRSSGKTAMVNFILRSINPRNRLLLFDFYNELELPEIMLKKYLVGYGERANLRMEPTKKETRELIKSINLNEFDTIVFDDVYGAEVDSFLSNEHQERNFIMSVNADNASNGMKSLLLNTPYPDDKEVPKYLFEIAKNTFNYGITISDKIKIEKLKVTDSHLYFEEIK